MKTRIARDSAAARRPGRPIPAAMGTAGWAQADADRARIRTVLRAPSDWRAPATTSVPRTGEQAETIGKHGISGSRTSLPYLERAQASFGAAHDLSAQRNATMIQAKLKVSEPGDIYEQEADRISGQVLAAPAQTADGKAPCIRRAAEQPTGETASAPAGVEHVLTSAGNPLEPALRREMEQRFDWDFSRVRVHIGSAAEQSARDLNARAYTVGANLVFGAGEFEPQTHEGRRLLAHELTHVVQQSGAEPNVVRRSNGFDDDEPTLVERQNPNKPPFRGHVERGGEKVPGNIASGEIDAGKPRGPTSGGGGGGTASKFEAEAAKAEGKAARALGSVVELGKVGALDAALFYLQIHAAHFEALENVSKRVEIANNLLNHVEEFEKGARALRTAVNALRSAEAALPGEPLATGDDAAFAVGLGELEYVDAYAHSAANIVSKAFDARVKLIKIIEGWDTVVAQGSATRDFTRKALVEAVQILDLRFSKEVGGNFRGFLIDARDDAGRVEAWARSKWHYAKDIVDTANLPLRRAIDKAASIRNDLMNMAKQERQSAGVLVAIDYLKVAQGANDVSVALEAVKSSLSVLQGISGAAHARARLLLLKKTLEALSSDR
jgi:hypothetical protein